MISCREEHSRARGPLNLHKLRRFRCSEMDFGVIAVIFDNLNISLTWAAFQQTFCEQKSWTIDSSQKVTALKPCNITFWQSHQKLEPYSTLTVLFLN